MTKFEAIDVPNSDEEVNRGQRKNKKFNPDNVSAEDVVGESSHHGSMDPAELYELMEEGKIPKSAVYDVQKSKTKKTGSNLNLEDFELEPESEDESSYIETTATEKEVEEIISKSKEEALSKERAALISKKRDDEFSDIESHGKRGKEHKGKFKKGLESIKRLLKIK